MGKQLRNADIVFDLAVARDDDHQLPLSMLDQTLQLEVALALGARRFPRDNSAARQP